MPTDSDERNDATAASPAAAPLPQASAPPGWGAPPPASPASAPLPQASAPPGWGAPPPASPAAATLPQASSPPPAPSAAPPGTGGPSPAPAFELGARRSQPSSAPTLPGVPSSAPNLGRSDAALDLLSIAEAGPAPSLLDEVAALLLGVPAAPSREALESGLLGLIAFVARTGVDVTLVDNALVDLLIASLTERISRQVDVILHNPTFQALEAAWRGLAFVVDRVEFRENIRVKMLNVSKRDLLDDFQDAPEVAKSGIYRIAYSSEYGVFGGRPYGVIVANYEFTPSAQDIYLLDKCASVATMAHAPFIAAAASKFFGLDDYLDLPQLSDLHSLHEGPAFTKWRAFRDSDDARYVALCLPRFLLRLPYGPRTVRVRAFEYEEDVVGHHEHYLWGNAAFAFATRIADSFARYRWCPNIIGPSTGGTVADLPLHRFDAMGEIQTKIPTEVIVTERRESEIAEQGFIAFTYRRDTENACFFSANSCQRPKTFGISEEGRRAALNHRLGTQLPYLFVSSRIAHYLKVLQREQIGTWKGRQDLERELQKWINQFVADQASVTPGVRAKRPLRKAKISVSEVEGSAGWYKVDVQLRPHFRYMGVEFDVGFVGRLDKE
ncbi:MAG: type VI secretion system contractile sheath large subunit [Deltaproteobacteria bacterium]|nr:type VI secretion system contractile sheath large subunit [Deltaproteobacteria bacterium]